MIFNWYPLKKPKHFYVFVFYLQNAGKGKENLRSVDKANKIELAREKERLQKLANNYSKKIQELKDLQAKRDTLIQKTKSPEKKLKKQIPRLEKIEVDSDVPDDIVIQPSKRRRSLREINPSNKPNIVHNTSCNVSVLSKSSADNRGGVTPKSTPENINKLDMLQLRKLKTLQVSLHKYTCIIETPTFVKHFRKEFFKSLI